MFLSGGKQIGDHPPITPTRVATKEDVGGGLEWRVYEYVTRHFLGSLMGDMKFRELKSDVQIGGHHLIHKQIIVDEVRTVLIPSVPNSLFLPLLRRFLLCGRSVWQVPRAYSYLMGSFWLLFDCEHIRT